MGNNTLNDAMRTGLPQHDIDHQYMAQAILQAQQAIYRARPNPAVGCVIVKEQQIIARGATAPVGGAHAEVFALRQAGEDAQGATVYVTLEPCAHYGRTPPCAKALIDAQVKKVVIATLDPNPLVAGKGREMLQQAGIEVVTGILEAQAQAQNRGFLKVMAGGLPYVRLKIAASLDGRTAMASGESKWITGEHARQDVQHWRAISGAVITGIQTILYDDPQLNVRYLPNVELSQVVQPYRVILDRQGQLPLWAKILQHPQNLIVVGKYRAELEQLGVIQLATCPLATLLQTLKTQFQIYDVLIEAGATLSSCFLAEQLVDEVIQYIAPMYLGKTARPLNQFEFETMQQRLQMKLLDVQQIQQDLRLHLQPIYEAL